MLKKHFPELSDSFYLTSVYFFLLLHIYLKIKKAYMILFYNFLFIHPSIHLERDLVHADQTVMVVISGQ